MNIRDIYRIVKTEKKSCKYSYWKYLNRILEFPHNWNWVLHWREMEYIVFDKHLLRMSWNNILIYARMILFFCISLLFFFYENFPSDFYLLVLFILIKLICYKKNCNFYIKSSCIDSTRAESILFVRRKRRRQTEWMKHVWMFILSIGWNFFHKYT